LVVAPLCGSLVHVWSIRATSPGEPSDSIGSEQETS
jgi:hypothetical protein